MKNDKKQTAVDWLIEQFENHRATFFKLNDKEERVITLVGRDVIAEAKKMEKEQMMDAWEDDRFPLDKEWVKQCADKYYEHTYGGNK